MRAVSVEMILLLGSFYWAVAGDRVTNLAGKCDHVILEL
jgi:hypothetical protein